MRGTDFCRVDLVSLPVPTFRCRERRSPGYSLATRPDGGFRFVDLENWRDPQFLPGVVRYGDLPGLLALNAPEELCILGEGDDIPTLTGDIYKIRGKAESVVTRPGLAEGLKWLE